MKYRHTGLYHYCLNLGTSVRNILEKEGSDEIFFYVPPMEAAAFKDGDGCIIEKKWQHKLIRPFLLNCDVWHAPFQSGRLVPTPHKRIKIVLTIHDLNVLHEDKPQIEKTESLRRTQRLIDCSDAIVCISNHTKKDVLENLHVGSRPLHVIYNGTHSLLSPGCNPAYIPVRPFVFAIGYVNRKKNFHTLLSLLNGTDIELVIAGKLDEPDYAQSIKEKATALGHQEKVVLLGPVSEEEKSWYFENCMAFAMPSLAEGFGAPVVEAMSFGKPVFLSSKTSLPEIGGDVSFYFDSFDEQHMKNVFHEGLHRYRQDNMAERIRLRCRQFDWEEKGREYISVYKSLL